MDDPTALESSDGHLVGRRTRHLADGVALGAHYALFSGPKGSAALWQRFVEVHGGDEDAALGQLLLRVLQLEDRRRGDRPS
jgi:hypothetical protein